MVERVSREAGDDMKPGCRDESLDILADLPADAARYLAAAFELSDEYEMDNRGTKNIAVERLVPIRETV